MRQGAYILADAPDGKPDLILIASGSEVALAVEARKKLLDQQVKARVVSMPSWELFDVQSRETRDAVLPPSVTARLAIEAGIPQGWHRYVGTEGDVMGLDHFGASAPGGVVMREFGFTVENVCQQGSSRRFVIVTKNQLGAMSLRGHFFRAFLCVIHHPLEIDDDYRLIADDPGIMAGRKQGNVPCPAIHLRPIIHLDMEGP